MWTSLWNATASGLRKYSAEERWHAEYAQRYWHPTLPHLTPEELLAEDRKFAGECLEIMKCIENGDDTLRSNPPMHEPAFPDELVAALGFFILPEDVSS
ncbi:uncharacterized protein PHACADRAFT_258812 [Phanerochaete carnosa HHB-10118-sp]|uniref:Uncharacterized protein n=1 Tax=Phanerochaete carnosa (strain HHB-10118-sp) TaxID=650164 RepID=K5W723_PHACS|nr:uncharacterized protein PHACADRAFT_258812 [Phanerochaete carnosa HHB-10118-sp]EKM54759.1 hypothetical protein PHACADRAFT_258812 [Phanerochaete carnosa HHB-10118-sp]